MWEHAQFIGPDVQVMQGWIIPAIILASYVISAIGKLKSGSNQKKLAEFNASVADQQAADAILRGKTEEEKFRAGVKTLIGGQRADFAAQSIDIGSGSAADVQADAAYLGELDARQIRTNAQLEALGFKNQAQSYRMGGQAAQTSSYFDAGATVLGGTGSLLLQRYGWGDTKKKTPSPS